MSGSPKYSSATFAAEQEQRLLAEQRQRAQAAERRRRQLAEQEEQRLREQQRQQLRQLWAQRRTVLATHQAASYGRFAAAAWSELSSQLEAGLRACEGARSAEQLQSAQQQLAALDREFAVCAARAQAAERAEQLRIEMERRAAEHAEQVRRQVERRAAELTTELMLLQGELLAVESSLNVHADPGGTLQIRSIIQQAQACITEGQMDAAEVVLDKARASIREHAEQLKRRLAEHAAARQAADTALNALRSQLVGLEADEVVMAWCRAEVAAVADDLARATEAIADGQIPSAANLCQRATQAIAALLQKAEQRQLEEEKRSYLVSSLVEVLRQQEFLVNEPQLAAADDLDSTVVIHATRPDRRSLLLQIPKSGPVAYEVDGYEKRLEETPSGAVASCDEAEARLLAIHSQLEAEFGIQMGEIYWDGRDPQRRSRDGRPLPGSAAQTRQRGR